MSFRFIYPFLFLLLAGLPFIFFVFIKQSDSQATFIAISGVASFLFGLLATFTLTSRHSRLDNVVKNAAAERAELAFIAESLVLFPKQKQKIIDLMDEYFMAQLDLEAKYFYLTDEQFMKLYDKVLALEIKEEKQKKMYDRLIMAMEKIENNRKYSATLFEDRIAWSEWVILYFLIAVIYISLLFSNSGGLTVLAVIVVLAVIISYILVVAIKLDRMKWKVDEKIFEPYAQTMETIGLLRYYPKMVFDENSIKRINRLPKGSSYRIGETPNYPDLKGRIIKVHKVK